MVKPITCYIQQRLLYPVMLVLMDETNNDSKTEETSKYSTKQS